MRRTRILVAIDDTEAAVAAVDVTGAIASAMKADVAVLQVHQPGKADPSNGPRARAVRLLADRGVPARIEERSGDPAGEILAAARAVKADLLVMGSRGRSRLTGMLLGSVSQEVLASPACPVLLVRGDTAMIRAPYSILVAVEGIAGLDALVRIAGRLARALSARVHVIHVDFPGAGELERSLYHATRAHGDEALAAAAAKLRRSGVPVETRTIPSTAGVSRAIAAYAEEIGADLIVMGAHAPEADFEPARTGQAVAVSHASRRPVLVTREGPTPR